MNFGGSEWLLYTTGMKNKHKNFQSQPNCDGR